MAEYNYTAKVQIYPPTLPNRSRAIQYNNEVKYWVIYFRLPSQNRLTDIKHIQVSVRSKISGLSVLSPDIERNPTQQGMAMNTKENVLYLDCSQDAQLEGSYNFKGASANQNPFNEYNLAHPEEVASLSYCYRLVPNDHGESWIAIPFNLFNGSAEGTAGPSPGKDYTVRIRFGRDKLWTVYSPMLRYSPWHSSQTSTQPSGFGEWSNTTLIFSSYGSSGRIDFDLTEFLPKAVFSFYGKEDDNSAVIDPVTSVVFEWTFQVYNPATESFKITQIRTSPVVSRGQLWYMTPGTITQGPNEADLRLLAQAASTLPYVPVIGLNYLQSGTEENSRSTIVGVRVAAETQFLEQIEVSKSLTPYTFWRRFEPHDWYQVPPYEQNLLQKKASGEEGEDIGIDKPFIYSPKYLDREEISKTDELSISIPYEEIDDGCIIKKIGFPQKIPNGVSILTSAGATLPTGPTDSNNQPNRFYAPEPSLELKGHKFSVFRANLQDQSTVQIIDNQFLPKGQIYTLRDYTVEMGVEYLYIVIYSTLVSLSVFARNGDSTYSQITITRYLFYRQEESRTNNSISYIPIFAVEGTTNAEEEREVELHSWSSIGQYSIYNQRWIEVDSAYGRLSSLDGVMLSDESRQLKIQGNISISGFTRKVDESFQTTLGSKYPYYFRGSEVGYRTMQLSGAISINFDINSVFLHEDEYGLRSLDNQLLILNKDMYDYAAVSLARRRILDQRSGSKKIISLQDDPRSTILQRSRRESPTPPSNNNSPTLVPDLDSLGIASDPERNNEGSNRYEDTKHLLRLRELTGPGTVYDKYRHFNQVKEYGTDYTNDDLVFMERKFREQVLNYLTDGKPKLFRSEMEGNMIVICSNVSMQPINTSRIIYSVSMTITEIAEFNYDNLKKYKLAPNLITNKVSQNSGYAFNPYEYDRGSNSTLQVPDQYNTNVTTWIGGY